MALTQISTAGVKDDAVTSGKIPADAVGSSEIAANAVGSSELADNAVDTAAIADDAVTADKIANSINTAIAANTAKTSNATHTGDVTGSTSLTIANDAVTTAKLADDAVTAAKLANDAVISSNIVNGAVDSDKIADATIGLDKLVHGTGSNDGKFLRANNGADPTFETVTGTTINSNADNRVITGSGTANTLTGESNLTFDGNRMLSVSTTGHAYGTLNLDGTAGGLIQFEDNDTLIWEIYTNTTELSIYDRVTGAYNTKFKSGGNVEIENGDLKFASGHGIDFSATSGSGTSELFDDYEEGTFAAINAHGGVWYSNSNECMYTKVGRLVHIQGQIRASSGSGNVRLSLPFAVSDFTDSAGCSAGSLATYDWNAAGSSDSDTRVIMADEGVSYARFMEIADNAAWSELQWDAGAYLRFHLCYITDS